MARAHFLIKSEPSVPKRMKLVTRSRISVSDVTPEHYELVLALGGGKP